MENMPNPKEMMKKMMGDKPDMMKKCMGCMSNIENLVELNKQILEELKKLNKNN
jgi:hypothetical protein